MSIKNGDNFQINHKGRVIKGVVESVTPGGTHFLVGGCHFILRTARSEYAVMMRADGFAWVGF
tara:strand:- start:168 stop:356 length:189 start_codon:yes stop_codon:yes gene_type:complete